MSIEVVSRETQRAAFVGRGRYLEYFFTIAYNSLEGLIAVSAGLVGGSIALVGFGFDSLIEVTSGAVLLWRLRADVDEQRRERAEAISLRIVGVCFVVLIIMPLLVRAKRKVACGIKSSALMAASKQTELCTYLSRFYLAAYCSTHCSVGGGPIRSRR
jgi:divalent metal cation (Fe/Co/Zn/Cd) transporter